MIKCLDNNKIDSICVVFSTEATVKNIIFITN